MKRYFTNIVNVVHLTTCRLYWFNGIGDKHLWQ